MACLLSYRRKLMKDTADRGNENESKKKFQLQVIPRRQRLKPGPIVTATAERSLSVRLALSKASCTTCKYTINHIY